MKVLVIGDTIVDEYVYGTKLGLSAETPTIVAKELAQKTFLGGAAFVVRNLLRLGCEVIFFTTESSEITPLLEDSSDPLSREELLRLTLIGMPWGLGDRWTATRKKRFFVDSYKLLQFDRLCSRSHDRESLEDLTRLVSGLLPLVDKVVFSDYRHGVIDESFVKTIVQLARKDKIPVIVDSQVSQKESNLSWYRNVNEVFLNMKEMISFLKDETEVSPQVVLSKLNADLVFLKNGEQGLSVTSKDGTIVKPAFKVSDVVDTCGAGDCLLAAYVATGDIDKAQHWAAESVRLSGTTVPDRDKIRD